MVPPSDSPAPPHRSLTCTPPTAARPSHTRLRAGGDTGRHAGAWRNLMINLILLSIIRHAGAWLGDPFTERRVRRWRPVRGARTRAGARLNAGADAATAAPAAPAEGDRMPFESSSGGMCVTCGRHERVAKASREINGRTVEKKGFSGFLHVGATKCMRLTRGTRGRTVPNVCVLISLRLPASTRDSPKSDTWPQTLTTGQRHRSRQRTRARVAGTSLHRPSAAAPATRADRSSWLLMPCPFTCLGPLMSRDNAPSPQSLGGLCRSC
jgi:hypothetical protein